MIIHWFGVRTLLAHACRKGHSCTRVEQFGNNVALVHHPLPQTNGFAGSSSLERLLSNKYFGFGNFSVGLVVGVQKRDHCNGDRIVPY